MKKFKKTTAALLVAGLTVAGSSYAWANEAIFNSEDETAADVTTATEIEPVVTLVPSNNESEETTIEDETTSPESLVEETTEESTNEDTTIEEFEVTTEDQDEETESAKEVTKDNEFPEIPEGYTAGNLAALKQAYENAGSENAKQAILKNALKAIAKFEAKYGETKISTETKAEIQVKLELIGIKNPGETIQPVLQEQPKVVSETIVKAENQTSSKETEVQQNTDKKSLKAEQNTEVKALQEEHKAEMKALKEEHKAENKALKEKNKEVKKNGKDKE
ncbi:hypothetical protein ACOQFO_10250 [Ureibacillus sp. MALMAid1270]|uniref:hypothetical protein n=1 Tax=Ureibacillus sp. MALMAid1270 TaxID=3411629 RepID=UPI003BA6F085